MPGTFSAARRRLIAETKYLYIRAGREHRFIAVWAVLVDGRVIVRSWNDKPAGWHRAFLEDPRGAIRLGDREVPVRAVRVRSSRVIDAVDTAYGEKYTTPANRKYVKGFATAKRKATTLELRPA